MPSATAPRGTLAEEHVEFLLQKGIAVYVGSRSADHTPALVRALGRRISRDHRRVTVLVSIPQAQEVLDHIRATGTVAAVFTWPKTHATLQLKGADAAVTKPLAGDAKLMERFRQEFVEHLEPLGFAPALVSTLMTSPEGEIAGITFTPYAVFTQTPGPKAGQAVGGLR